MERRGYRGSRGGGYSGYEHRRNDYNSRGGYSGREPHSRPAVEFPTEPPFTAYVGNLSFQLEEQELWTFFQEEVKCQVLSVRVVRDRNTGRSKGFGYVNFETANSLRKALEASGDWLHDRQISVDLAEPKVVRSRTSRSDAVDVWSKGEKIVERRGYRPPPSRGSPFGRRRIHSRENKKAKDNLPVPSDPPYIAFIGNLSYHLTEEDVKDFFADFKITNVKLARTRDGRAKGFGFVTFESSADLSKALELNEHALLDRNVRIVVADRDAMQDADKGDGSTAADDAGAMEEVAAFLADLQLDDLLDIFKKERIDMRSLNLLSETDLRELSIPVGPRRLIQDELVKRREAKVDNSKKAENAGADAQQRHDTEE